MVINMVSEKRVKKYLSKTKEALDKVDLTAPKRSHNFKIAKDFLEMAVSYYSDAEHFLENDELDDAFACVNYAHGWLDAGARLGLFDTGGDDQLFTLLS